MEKKESLNKNHKNNKYMATLWDRILLGATGGILIMGGIWVFFSFTNEFKYLAIIPIVAGIFSLFFARNV